MPAAVLAGPAAERGGAEVDPVGFIVASMLQADGLLAMGPLKTSNREE
jgi:hypothetical protein